MLKRNAFDFGGVCRELRECRRLLPVIAILLMTTIIPAAAAEADAKLAEFFRNYLEADCQLSPMRASRLGDHRCDHLLDDVSAGARERRTELARRTLQELPRQVDFAGLSPAGQVDYQILRHNLETGLWLEELERPWETDPRIYTSLATDCAYVLLTQSTLPKETNIRNAVARIQLVPGLLAAGRQNLRHPPRVVTETVIKQNKGAIAFYEGELFEMVGDTSQIESVRKAAALAGAALRQHQDYLEQELLPRSTGDWRLGRESFARKFERVLDSGFTADQVLAEAETAFAQVHRDMLLVSRQLWARYFPTTPLPPDDTAGRRETIERVIRDVGRDHGQPAELASNARATVARLKQFIMERKILRLPDPDRCQILEMPEFQRGNSIAFLNSAPPLDATAPSIYAISPPPQDWDAPRVESFLNEYNSRMLQILTIHEVYPGHYVQLDYANRQPSVLRRVLGAGTFEEGWANYCEQMMLDQGYGDGDLALRLMQLKFHLRTVANVILDHKMHCTTITDDEAMPFLVGQAFQTEGEARLKVIRAKQSSVQLSSYFVGRMAFMRLRQQVQREMGSRFNLARFHEAVLEHGSVPVKYLPELVQASLQTKKPKP